MSVMIVFFNVSHDSPLIESQGDSWGSQNKVPKQHLKQTKITNGLVQIKNMEIEQIVKTYAGCQHFVGPAKIWPHPQKCQQPKLP
jgi:hypothetical protein